MSCFLRKFILSGWILFAIAIPLIHSCSGKEDRPASGPVEAADALSTFQLADGFQIEMVASEPLVTDPVDMEIDENGLMYVVEMHGYPLDKSGSGNIIILSDGDGDGVMDKRTVFKDSLMLPTSLLRWKKGIIVTDSPNILYLEDTDGDGQANITDTILHGFALTNPQHNMNSPIYGLDNWIYVAHEDVVGTREYKEEFGDEGRDIIFYRDSAAVRLPKNANGQSIRFRPDTKQLEMLSSRCQFGHTFDEWGHRFNCGNSNQGYQEVIANRYFERNPNMFVSESVQSMSDHMDAAEVFPSTIHPDRQLLTDPGVLTSACGLTKYMGNAFPEPYNTNVTFIAEPVSNLVHVDLLKDSGATFVASRILKNKEFLTSTDAWSRPVNFYVGPDGALYMLDYYRRVIESPEWMSDEAIKAGNLYDGSDKGRIYRITPTGAKKAEWTKGLKLGSAQSEELVKYLADPNYWWRINAQRLLVDRGDKNISSSLANILDSNSPLARVHALWTLDGLGALQPSHLLKALKDSIAGVRENAVQLAEKYLDKSPELETALINLQNDANEKVRFQLLLSLGFINSAEAATARNNILFRDIKDKWIQIAALSASSTRSADLLATILDNHAEDEQYTSMIERLSSVIGATGTRDDIHKLIRKAISINNSGILKGLSDGYSGRRSIVIIGDSEQKLLIDHYFNSTSLAQTKPILDVLKENGITNTSLRNISVKRAASIMNDTVIDYRKRAAAASFVQLGQVETYADDLKKLVNPREETIVQTAALQTLAHVKGPMVSEYVIQQWPLLTTEVRTEALSTFLTDSSRTALLIDALETNKINPGNVSFSTSVRLMQDNDSTLRNRARNIFTKSEREREKVNKEYKAALQLKGDEERGRQVYIENCAICHQVRGKIGIAVGPDLGTVHNWIKEDLLVNILDPNMSVASGYDTWQAELNNGETVQGIIAAETPAAITLRSNNMQDRLVNRQDLRSLKALNTSLMPSGLEKTIDKQKMADLIEFLRSRE